MSSNKLVNLSSSKELKMVKVRSSLDIASGAGMGLRLGITMLR